MLDPRSELAERVHRILRLSYGLTTAESQIAQLLIDGYEPLQIASIRERSLATVRTQVRRILAKAGARRQLDLVRNALVAAYEERLSRELNGATPLIREELLKSPHHPPVVQTLPKVDETIGP
jgi:DNA-binding CsgD family transcriptional regulator